jgi:DNA-binding MarR family transcriptional regulator
MSASKHRLYLHLQLAAHHVKKQADRALMDAAALTTAQAAVLSLLSEGKKVTQRTVAETLGQNESAVTAMIRRLMKLGYVDRKRDSTDARAWLLEITPEGRTALAGVAVPFSRINETFEKALSVEEIANLSDYLARINAAFSRG